MGEGDLCVICLEVLGDDVYSLDPCGHRFHTDCIMKWVRSRDGSCPVCRYVPSRLEEGAAVGRVSFLRNYALRKGAPKELKKIACGFRCAERRHKENVNNLREYLDNPSNREVLRHIKRLKDNIWKSKIGMIKEKDKLLGYPIVLLPNSVRTNEGELGSS